MKYAIYYIIISIQLFSSNYCKAQSATVIINEIMADPEPAVGLPAVEYVELKNVGSGPIELKNMQFKDRSTQAILPEFILKMGSRVILCPMTQREEFSDSIASLGLDPWPRLNNLDDDLELISASGISLDVVSYERSWYHNTAKDDGGYSLERIGLGSGCEESQYWRASKDISGGTPGEENSYRLEDSLPPVLLKAFGENSFTVLLQFSEGVSSLSIPMMIMSLDPPLQVDSIYKKEENILAIKLGDELITRRKYKVRVRNTIDCQGNLNSQEQVAVLVLPEKSDSMDVVINEILFNPKDGGTDFLEIHNRSDKYLNIADWQMGNWQDSLVNQRKIVTENFLLSPRDFLILTNDINKIRSHYPKSSSALFIEMDLPVLSNTAGSVAMANTLGRILDVMKYEESYHYSILQDLNGVSLERIDPWGISLDKNNWMSAAETENFATPGYQNSQASGQIIANQRVSIDPEIIIPNNDGDRDYAKINYDFEHGGNIAHINVYDMEGNEIVVIASNVLLGLTGFFIWDGTDWRGRKVDFGPYLVLFQVFRTDGSTASWLGRVVVGSNF